MTKDYSYHWQRKIPLFEKIFVLKSTKYRHKITLMIVESPVSLNDIYLYEQMKFWLKLMFKGLTLLLD